MSSPKKPKLETNPPPNVYIHPAALNVKRKDIMSKNITKLGGKEISSLKGDIIKNTVILLNLSDIPRDKIDGICKRIMDETGGMNNNGVQVVNTNWLSESIKAGGFLDLDSYQVKNLYLQMSCDKSKPSIDKNSKNQSFEQGYPAFESKFVCSQSSSSEITKHNLNSVIIEELSTLAKVYKTKNDKWRVFGYEKAIGVIKRYPKKIEHPSEVREIPGLGKKMSDKIAEILENGKLTKRIELQDDEKLKVIELFSNIWGVGPTTAEIFYNQGHRNLEHLREANVLTRQQQIGLNHYNDFKERMTRDEAFQIWRVVKERTESLRTGVEVIACGSYRRGKATCGDLDILITHKVDSELKGLFDELLIALHNDGFLTDDLTRQKDKNQRKYLGVCKLPGDKKLHRRIDIIVVPYEEKACALVYFTGSAHFNRSMRLLAIKKGMSLSEHSLNKVIRAGKEKVCSTEIISTPSEESLFEILGIPYRLPNERDH